MDQPTLDTWDIWPVAETDVPATFIALQIASAPHLYGAAKRMSGSNKSEFRMRPCWLPSCH